MKTKESRDELLSRAGALLADPDVSAEKKENMRAALEAMGVDVAEFEAGARQIAKAFQMTTPPAKARARDLKALRGGR